MKKTLKYFSSLENIAIDMLKELPNSVLEQIESLIEDCRQDEDIKIEPLSDETIANATKYIKLTAKKRHEALLGKDDAKITISIFPALYMLAKAHISCNNIIDSLWLNARLSYKDFAAQSLQNLYSLSRDDVLRRIHFFLAQARLYKSQPSQ